MVCPSVRMCVIFMHSEKAAERNKMQFSRDTAKALDNNKVPVSAKKKNL